MSKENIISLYLFFAVVEGFTRLHHYGISEYICFLLVGLFTTFTFLSKMSALERVLSTLCGYWLLLICIIRLVVNCFDKAVDNPN